MGALVSSFGICVAPVSWAYPGDGAIIGSISLGTRTDMPDPLAEPGNIVPSFSVAVRVDMPDPLAEPGGVVSSMSVTRAEADKDFHTKTVYVD